MNRLRQALEEHGPGPLLGIAVYSYNPLFLEMAAHLGFRVIWIEMEHAFITFAEAADLCRMAKGRGMLTMIRIPNAQRENVAKAVECGPDIVDVPMVESQETAYELIRNARFPPEGERGFFSVSRALDYGLVDNVADEQQRLNEELCLMIQIETATAVERIEEICAVPEVEIFIGPSDLSASLGVPGQLGHPKVFEAARKVVNAARRNGKLVAVGAGVGEFGFYTKQGIDLLFCGNDIACLGIGMRSALQQAYTAVLEASGEAVQNIVKEWKLE
jgi:4-hydroxy-2-oxoheptanedioate aldolase